ncbi:MAG: hypothetical protein K8M05_08065 [Deltaproteobacteria bacterium]|nr:hypothetical protein [Kofleriaceae bacterium]
MRRALPLLIIGAIAGRAAADDAERHVRSVMLEGGFYYAAGVDDGVSGVEIFAGVTGEPAAVRVGGGRGFVALGARVQYGSVQTDHEIAWPQQADPSAVTMAPAYGLRWTAGPELRAGVAWPEARWPGYTFVAVEPFWSNAWADRVARPWISEIGQRRGARAAVGAAVRHVLVEVSWEHVAGADRAGLSLRGAL